MLKINKYLNLTRKLPQVSWTRKYNYDTDKCPARYECKQPEPDEADLLDEEVKRRYVPAVFACKSHRDPRIFRNIFFFICIPAILCSYINIYYLNDEHRQRPKFVPYSYLRIRRKPYAWDPERTLFHNPDYNALPGGYETTFPEEDEYEPMDKYPCPVPRRT